MDHPHEDRDPPLNNTHDDARDDTSNEMAECAQTVEESLDRTPLSSSTIFLTVAFISLVWMSLVTDSLRTVIHETYIAISTIPTILAGIRAFIDNPPTAMETLLAIIHAIVYIVRTAHNIFLAFNLVLFRWVLGCENLPRTSRLWAECFGETVHA
ncbi:hypothetical protein F4778DRAFT_186530 [Xylariomycetidae sp. FL2044]|nr:hypothetical protein F4778DRAFT_186530 [Xylariomycetidae sp. FL2044]